MRKIYLFLFIVGLLAFGCKKTDSQTEIQAKPSPNNSIESCCGWGLSGTIATLDGDAVVNQEGNKMKFDTHSGYFAAGDVNNDNDGVIFELNAQVASFSNPIPISVGINTTSPTTALDINSDKIRLRIAKTPTSATATGNTGDIAWDTNFIYVCVATNTWKRTAITTW